MVLFIQPICLGVAADLQSIYFTAVNMGVKDKNVKGTHILHL